MKIYRCVIGFLMVFFIIIGVWYVASCYNEQRSTEDGTLILEKNVPGYWNEYEMRGVAEHVSNYGIC